MAIEFECPSCRARIRTPDEAAGKKARCPTCQQISPVPLSSTLPSAGSLSNPPLASSRPPSLQPLQPASQPVTSPAAPQQAPPTNPAPWLPPADVFAPKGPQQFGSLQSPPTFAPVQPANPFGDYPQPGSDPGIVNPYASPAGYGPQNVGPLSKEDVSAKLLGSAIGFAVCAFLSLSLLAMLAYAVSVDPEFHADMQEGGDPTETMFAYVFVVLFFVAAALPSLVSLIGAYAMYRGRGLVAAWVGSIAAILPCTPCFIISAGFAIWSMVVLSDARINAAMK